MKRVLITSLASAVAVTAVTLAWVYAPHAVQRYYPQGSLNYEVPIACLLVFVVASVSLWRSNGSTLMKVSGTFAVLVAVLVGMLAAMLILFGGTT